MNRNVKQALLFLLLVVGMLYAIQAGMDFCYRKRVTNKFSRLLSHQTDAEVMLFGSSVVYHQFNPLVIQSVTGKTVYNMGWPGMFYVQYRGLISEYLRYAKRCKYVVIGCDFDNLGRTELIRNPNLFYAYIYNSNLYNSLSDIEPRKIFLARYAPGYKLTLLGKGFYTEMALGRHYNDSLRGFDPLNNEWEATRPSALYKTRYDDTVFAHFKHTIDDILSKGIRVILVIPPVYKDGYTLIENADIIKIKYLSLIKKDVYILDYTTDSICSHKEYFHNFTHLNGTGANLFSLTFANDLLKIIHE